MPYYLSGFIVFRECSPRHGDNAENPGISSMLTYHENTAHSRPTPAGMMLGYVRRHARGNSDLGARRRDTRRFLEIRCMEWTEFPRGLVCDEPLQAQYDQSRARLTNINIKATLHSLAIFSSRLVGRRLSYTSHSPVFCRRHQILTVCICLVESLAARFGHSTPHLLFTAHLRQPTNA